MEGMGFGTGSGEWGGGRLGALAWTGPVADENHVVSDKQCCRAGLTTVVLGKKTILARDSD